MRQKLFTERNAQIVARYKAGERQRDLARAFHLSRARIGGILSDAGVSGQDNPKTRRNGNLTATVFVGITRETKIALRQRAKRQKQSISKLVNGWIEEKLAQQDLPPAA